MAIEQTCAIIKPDAVKNLRSGDIISLIELNKFNILKMEKRQISLKEAEAFYAVHKGKPFYDELIQHITSGPVVIMKLEKENCIADWRTLMGVTDPAKAAPGTIRKMFAESIGKNAVHGSDSVENAKIELGILFKN